ncbi:CDP-glycerol glycerophosphotransferase family protein, partial [Bacillus sp. D-CC]
NGNQHKPYEFKFDLNKFKEKFGEEYVLLLRLHYRDATRIQINGLEEFIYNVSSYNDIQELYLISDILIKIKFKFIRLVLITIMKIIISPCWCVQNNFLFRINI